MDVLEKMHRNIDEYGWHCLSVAPRVGESGASFTYTIGLQATYGHPEIMIFGLHSKTAHGILSDCVDKINAGTKFCLNQPISEVIGGGYKVMFKAIKAEYYSEYLGAALSYYGDRPFDGIVLFWPDKDHRFPWESAQTGSQTEAVNIV